MLPVYPEETWEFREFNSTQQMVTADALERTCLGVGLEEMLWKSSRTTATADGSGASAQRLDCSETSVVET